MACKLLLGGAHDRHPKAPAFPLRLRLRPLGYGHSDRPGEPPVEHRRRSPPASPARRMDDRQSGDVDRRQLLVHARRPAVRGLRVGQRGHLRRGASAGRTRRSRGAGRDGAGIHLRPAHSIPPVPQGRAPAGLSHRHGGRAPRRVTLGGETPPLHDAAGRHSPHSAGGGGPATALVVRAALLGVVQYPWRLRLRAHADRHVRGRRPGGVADQPPVAGLAQLASAITASRCCSPSAA